MPRAELRTLLPGFAPIQLDLCIATRSGTTGAEIRQCRERNLNHGTRRSLFWGARYRAPVLPREGAIKDGPRCLGGGREREREGKGGALS